MPPRQGVGTPDKVIVCFGDSDADESPAGERTQWPDRLQARLNAAGTGSYRVINAEVPGLTTGTALDRIEPGVLFHRPHLVTLQFGSSDSRGASGALPTPVGQFEANLRAIAQLVRERIGAIVVFIAAPHSLRSGSPGAPDLPWPYRDVVGRVAYELNAPLLDLDAELRSARSVSLPAAGGQRLPEWTPEFYAESAFRCLKRLL